jgi:hypothetical protein
MRHRIAGLGGIGDVRRGDVGGTVVTATIPLSRMLIPENEGGVPVPASRVTALKKAKA